MCFEHIRKKAVVRTTFGGNGNLDGLSSERNWKKTTENQNMPLTFLSLNNSDISDKLMINFNLEKSTKIFIHSNQYKNEPKKKTKTSKSIYCLLTPKQIKYRQT